MPEEANPYLQQENYFEGYQEKIEALKHHPEVIEVDKLCYTVYNTEEGKKLIEVYKDRYLMPGFVNPTHTNASDACLYYEGFKEAFRLIINSIKAHKQRIDVETANQ